MKMILKRSAAGLLAVLLMIAGTACQEQKESPMTDPTGEEKTAATETDEKKEMTFTYTVALTEQELACIDPQDNINDYLVLINKQHPVDSTYVCPALCDWDTTLTHNGENRTLQLSQTAATALYAMLREMVADGISNVCVTSAYRDYTYQVWLFGYYIDQELESHPDWTREQAEALVLTYSAYPGTSEHHSGLCVDLWVNGMRELENYGNEGDYSNDVGFAETEAYTWLCANAYRFGFILRYPEGKEEITGYQYESWHWRFVGRETAAAIAAAGITLEEYLDQ